MNHALFQKIHHADYRETIIAHDAQFSPAERALLREILMRFDFDSAQEQALAHAVVQQSRFDPNATHAHDEEDDGAAFCAHCLCPPAPPLRDYVMWREQNTTRESPLQAA